MEEKEEENGPKEEQPPNDYFSDSSESNEKCPICLLSFYDQPIGTPDMCSHAFCGKCIEEWAKLVRTCPIDRIAFNTINIYESYENRKFLRSVTITKNVLNAFNNFLPIQDIPAETIVVIDVDRPGDKCEVCHRADREDVMLLCDDCDCGYHIDCLTPALREIPHGSWFCANCPQPLSDDESEVVMTVSGQESYVEPVRKKSRQVAQITRTKQSEVIRKTIMAILSRTKPGGRERRKKKRSRRSRPELRNPPEFDPALRNPMRSHRCSNDNQQERSNFRERIPMLNLFGSSRAFDAVYTDDEENEDSFFESAPIYVGEPDVEMLTSQVACRRNAGYRNVQNILKIKNIISAPRTRPTLKVTQTAAPPNLLDSILESQKIWHSKDGMKDVVFAKGGNISLKRRTDDAKTVPAGYVNDGADGPGTSTSSAAMNSQYQSGSSSNNRNHTYTNSSYAGASSQQQPSSSRSFTNSNFTACPNNSSSHKQGNVTINCIPLPPKKSFKDMFCDSDSDKEEQKRPARVVATSSRFSFANEQRPVQKPQSSDSESSGTDESKSSKKQDYHEQPIADPESYTPELRNFDMESDIQTNAPPEPAHRSFTPARPNENTPPHPEHQVNADNTTDLKTRRKRSKSKESAREPDKKRRNTDQHKRRRSPTRSPRRRTSRRRSRSPRTSRSKSKHRPNKNRSRERNPNRRYSRSPFDRRKPIRRPRSRSVVSPKSPAPRNRSSSKRTSVSPKTAVPRNRSRSRSAARKSRPNRKQSSKRRISGRSRSRSLSKGPDRQQGRPWPPRKQRGFISRSRSPSPKFPKTPPMPASPKVSRKEEVRASRKKTDPSAKSKETAEAEVEKFVYSKEPVAIIDLTNGIKEIIPSAKDIIVVSDSDHEIDPPNEKAVEPVIEIPPDNSLISELKATKLKISISEEEAAAHVVEQTPLTPTAIAEDQSESPPPVIPEPEATQSPQKSCPATPTTAITEISPTPAVQQLIAAALPVEIQKLLKTFETEKLLNNSAILSQISLATCLNSVLLPTLVPALVVPEAPQTVSDPKPIAVCDVVSLPSTSTTVAALPVAAAPAIYDSPYSPGSSDFDDLYNESMADSSFNNTTQSESGLQLSDSSFNKTDDKTKHEYDNLFGDSPDEDDDSDLFGGHLTLSGHKDDEAIFEEKKARNFSDPRDKDKYLIKLSLQKRASDESKEQLKPFYSTKQITKQEYKDILRSAVPKICRSREVIPSRIHSLIAAYVKKIQHQRKKK